MKKIAASALLMLLLSACGGGGSAPAPLSGSTAAQSVSTAGQAANSPFVVPLSSSVAQAVGIASTSFTLPVTLPANTQISANAGQPANIVVPFGVMRASLGSRKPESASIPDATARLFFTIAPPSNVAFSGDYAFSFTLQSPPIADAKYYIAAFDGANWIPNATGSSANVNGNTLTFTGTFPAITLSANTRYAFVIYTLPTTVNSSVTTATSATNAAVVKGLVDGAVTLYLPTATSAVSLKYVSTETQPASLPSLVAVAGVHKTAGFIAITPSANVTFPAGGKVVLTHPYSNDNHGPDTNVDGISPNSTATQGGGDNHDDGTPLIAVYDPTQANPQWIPGFGTYASDGVTESLSYTLPATVTLNAGTTYTFGVYDTTGKS